MRRPNYFGNYLSRLRLNGIILAGLVRGGGSTKKSDLDPSGADDSPPRKREQTLSGGNRPAGTEIVTERAPAPKTDSKE